jgi:ribosomal protein L11 methyltransferase
LIRLALRCRAEEAERALAELLELAPGGVEEVRPPDGEGLVEYAIYGAEGELPDLGAIRAAAAGALVEVRSESVPDDWADRWKRFYHPRLIGGRLYVRPPWERPAERGGVVEVVIDPGRAFGTGTHPTTVLCLELLLEESRPKGRPALLALFRRRQARSLCDLGCGSGVLAIAGTKLGFQPVLGVDAARDAISESERNARLNGVTLRLEQLDIRAAPAPVADVVTANLTTRLVTEVIRGWEHADRRPARLIASGFLAGEADDVASALGSCGLLEQRRIESGEWAAIAAGRYSLSLPSLP